MEARNSHGDGRRVHQAAWAALAVVLLSLPGAAGAAERVALVIGNSAYEYTGPLRNPGNDAADMAAALGRLGFGVVMGTDLDRDGFFDKLGEFEKAARGAEVTLFFYAGHGLQVDQRNWLAPVDAEFESKRDLERRGVKLDTVMESMPGRHNLVFLDACRNNPLAEGLARSMGLSRTTAATRGLAPVDKGSGRFIGYATAAGDVADDGGVRNSPFTAALLEHIETPGLSVTDMFGKVVQSVFDATGGEQEPWQASSLRGDPLHLALVAPSPPKDADTKVGDAARAYVQPVHVGTVAPYHALIGRFPGSLEAGYAKEQIAKLEGKPEPVVGAGGGPGDEAPPPGRKFRDCAGCPELVVVPEGSFTMGSPGSEEGRYDDEGPVRRVTIGRPFAVGVYEVTRGEYGRFVSATGRSMGNSCWTYEEGDWEERSGRDWRNPGFRQADGHPVVCVDWDDAKAYVRWLSGETGEAYRLLSESEWEYVARAGTGTARYWGESESGQCRNANGADASTDLDWRTGCNDGHARTSPVGTFSANCWELHDVLGNVWEWVEDCWNDSYRGAPSDGSAWESGECGKRVLRGGSWSDFPWVLRSATRFGGTSGLRNYYAGFRVARTLTP